LIERIGKSDFSDAIDDANKNDTRKGGVRFSPR